MHNPEENSMTIIKDAAEFAIISAYEKIKSKPDSIEMKRSLDVLKAAQEILSYGKSDKVTSLDLLVSELANLRKTTTNEVQK